MADISDVEQAIAAAVTSILYPAGTSQSSIVGALCRVYRGWPNSATLNADLGSGAVNVTVGADNASGRTTTRYLPSWNSAPVQPGATATTSAQAIAIGGDPVTGDVVGAIIDGTPYAYRIQPGDSPDIVASNLEQLIQANRMASVQALTLLSLARRLSQLEWFATVRHLLKAAGKKRIFGSFVGARRRHFGMRSRRLSISGLMRWTSCYCLTRPRPESSITIRPVMISPKTRYFTGEI